MTGRTQRATPGLGQATDGSKWLGSFGPKDAPDYEEVLRCMRCGFCLPHCPTYAVTNRERSSPRGRVALTKAVARGDLDLTNAVYQESFFCLDCRACTTVCPAGVKVGPMMEMVRAQTRSTRLSMGWRTLREFVLNYMLPGPHVMKMTMLPVRLYQRLGVQWMVRHFELLNLVPGEAGAALAKMEGMLPSLDRPLGGRLPGRVPAQGEKRGAVAYFPGCVMSLMYADVSRATISVLSHQGFDVIIPEGAKCCGAPHLAEGARDAARGLAEQNIDTLLSHDILAIVTDCAGCGAALKEYEELLDGRVSSQRLQAFRARVRDVSEFLADLGIRSNELLPVDMRVTYHEPCHLVHAQGIRDAPREVIKAIPGLELVEMSESDWCCGSAANWGLIHSAASERVLDRKMGNVRRTAADAVVTLNPGCHMQLTWGASRLGGQLQVFHLMELVRRSLPRSRQGHR